MILGDSLNDFCAIAEVSVHDVVKVISDCPIIDPTEFVKLVSCYFFVLTDPGTDTVDQLFVVMIHGLGYRDTCRLD